MEYLIAASILGTGLYLKSQDTENTVPKNLKPSGTNIYNSNRSQEIRIREQERANQLYDKSKDSINTNVIIPGPPAPIINNKVDFINKKLPVEFNQFKKQSNLYQELDQKVNQNIQLNKKIVKNRQQINTASQYEPIAGGWNGMSLSGEPIDPSTFKHNNMVPFFGSKVRQNVDELSTRPILETFTGISDTYQRKKEIQPLFEPQSNLTNPYGMQNLDRPDERYKVNKIRNNETPVEKVYVGPGLNQGFVATPSGGFQQADTRDYTLPKTVNQLRVKTNPKLTFQGRIISGKKISRPGKVGYVNKNNPDTYYINSPSRYFTTKGVAEGPKQRPTFVMKYVNRPKTEQEKRIGPAAPVYGTTEKIRSKVKMPNKQQLKKLHHNPVAAGGRWKVSNGQNDVAPDDYGKKGIHIQGNNRLTTGPSQYKGIAFDQENKKAILRNEDKPRETKKDNMVGNYRWAGNVEAPINRHQVYNPNDVARTTIKETNIHNNRTGNVDRGADGSYVLDPNTKAKTTVRETTMAENYIGNAENSQHNIGGYEVTEMEAPVTNRQDTSTDYTGISGPGSVEAPMSYEDIYNSTIRTVRQEIAVGRTPAAQGPKEIQNTNMVHMTTTRNGDLQNKHLDERGVSADRVINSLPQVELCGVTRDKETLPNGPIQNRLDPSMISAFQQNPYTKSLKSSY